MKGSTWLVIANSSEALIYTISLKAHKEYSLLKKLTHEKSRLKSSDLVTDEQGHYQSSGGFTHGKFSESSNAHENEHIVFAREITDFLDVERKKNQYEELLICAEPHFLGLLNKGITKEVESLIRERIEKDYIPLPQHQLDKVIQTLMDEFL